MGRKCSICMHSRVEQINDALARSEPYRGIAARFEVAATSLRRHRENHGTEVTWTPWAQPVRELAGRLDRLEQRDAWLVDSVLALARAFVQSGLAR